MSSLPQSGAPVPQERSLPDYLPARMVNEFVYCPRLFFYEWVEGVFRSSADTEQGAFEHRRVDKPSGTLPESAELAANASASEASGGEEKLHTRSLMLASEQHRLIARMDLVEAEGLCVTPVDYKKGRPREEDDELRAWPPDEVQIAVQALILREHGYECEGGVAYYATTRQRIAVPLTEELRARTLKAVEQAWALAEQGVIPAPLVDSPKCIGCSLAPVCLPDETNLLARMWAEEGGQLPLFEPVEALPAKPAAREVRRLVTARDELRPVYLNTPGLRVGKSGGVLQVKERDSLRQEIRIGEINQLNVMGNIQVSTQALQTLCEEGIPVCYFSMGGWFYGMTQGLVTKNVFLRQKQFRMAESEWMALRVARSLVEAKIRNQRTLLLRNHVSPPGEALRMLKELVERAREATRADELLGIEGTAARVYFGEFAGMLKGEEGEAVEGFAGFDFRHRNRRPPRDPVNALLSLAYSVLAKDLTITAAAVGFDPMVGFYHQPRFGRPALALDLMEPFRPLVADSAVLTAVNTRMVTARDFVKSGGAVALTAAGRKAFFRAYELRMDGLVTHPLFDYRVTYRRLLEVQTRLLARVVEGELGEYPAFVTR